MTGGGPRFRNEERPEGRSPATRACRGLAARQPQTARRDDVALDLARAAGDGRRDRTDVAVRVLAVERGERVARPEVRVEAKRAHAGAVDLLADLAAEHLA